MRSMTFARRAVVAGAGGLCALGLAATPAFAAAETGTMHTSFPAAGAQFTCGATTLTAVSGTVSQVFHINEDAQGIYHSTGTITINGVQLQDAAGNVYTVSGASWFGGKSTDPDGNDLIVATDTEHFVIHNAAGGVYAKVQAVEHMSPNGNVFDFDFGGCEPPGN